MTKNIDQLNMVAALKNADALLHDVLKVVDTSGDGQIQYNGLDGYLPGCTTFWALLTNWLSRIPGIRRAR